jgi:hypothetical protein
MILLKKVNFLEWKNKMIWKEYYLFIYFIFFWGKVGFKFHYNSRLTIILLSLQINFISYLLLIYTKTQ